MKCSVACLESGSLREENSISIHWGPNSFLHISRHAKKSLALDERISQLTWTGLIQGVFKLIPAMKREICSMFAESKCKFSCEIQEYAQADANDLNIFKLKSQKENLDIHR